MKGTSPTRERAMPARHRSAKIEMWFFNLNSRGEVMDKVTTVGIDVAKSVFSLHGVDGAGRVMLRRTVRRDQLIVAALSPCLIGMEACSGAHEWAFLEVAQPLVIPLPRATLNESAWPEREFMLIPTSFGSRYLTVIE